MKYRIIKRDNEYKVQMFQTNQWETCYIDYTGAFCRAFYYANFNSFEEAKSYLDERIKFENPEVIYEWPEKT